MSNPDAIVKAKGVADKLGHLVLRQGRSFECARCGASGCIDGDGKRTGSVFRARCG